MRWFGLICVMSACIFAMGGEELDSLLKKTEKLEQKQVKGFVYKQQQQVQLTPPEELFKDKTDADSPKPATAPALGLNGLSSIPVDPDAPARGGNGGSSSGGTSMQPFHGTPQYVSYREFATEMRAMDKKLVEIEANQNKVTEILKNIHGSSERAIDGVNLAMKLLEVVGAVMAAVIGVASALVAYARVKRAKS